MLKIDVVRYIPKIVFCAGGYCCRTFLGAQVYLRVKHVIINSPKSQCQGPKYF